MIYPWFKGFAPSQFECVDVEAELSVNEWAEKGREYVIGASVPCSRTVHKMYSFTNNS